MKLRLIELLDGQKSVAAWHDGTSVWVPLTLANKHYPQAEVEPSAFADMISFLQIYKTHKDLIFAMMDHYSSLPQTVSYANENKCLIPFTPLSLRDCSLSEKHNIDFMRQAVKQFMPKPLYWLTQLYEMVVGDIFPLLKPSTYWYNTPVHYTGMPTHIFTNGDVIPYPSFCTWMDYELEVAAIITQQIKNASAKQAKDAIGAFCLFNDFSVRNVQVDEILKGKLGVSKTKNFANAIGHIVVTSDEIFPLFDQLHGKVSVNNELWSAGKPDDFQFTVEEAVAFISQGEELMPGEIIATGTFPGCSGFELGKKLQPGDKVEIELEPFGTLQNTIGQREEVVSWQSTTSKRTLSRKNFLPVLLRIVALLLIPIVVLFRLFNNRT